MNKKILLTTLIGLCYAPTQSETQTLSANESASQYITTATTLNAPIETDMETELFNFFANILRNIQNNTIPYSRGLESDLESINQKLSTAHGNEVEIFQTALTNIIKEKEFNYLDDESFIPLLESCLDIAPNVILGIFKLATTNKHFDFLLDIRSLQLTIQAANKSEILNPEMRDRALERAIDMFSDMPLEAQKFSDYQIKEMFSSAIEFENINLAQKALDQLTRIHGLSKELDPMHEKLMNRRIEIANRQNRI